jgi:molecular chaperone DnaK (HSP70)
VQTDASPRVQIVALPRVQFNIEANEEIQFDANEAPQLIVESPRLIVKSPTKRTPESIANRVKKGLQNAQSSIAERVAQQRRESAKPVLDHETGKLLKYCQLLLDPKHKECWA